MRYHSSQSGFSLIETLVAISLLLIIIVGPMTISSSTARSTSFASEQVIAFFLAQEGAELAQKARDDLVLENFENPSAGGWSEFVDDSFSGTYSDCFTPEGCGLELNTDQTGSLKTPFECDSGECQLYFDSSGGRSQYTHESSAPDTTPYTRVITMDEIAGREVEVVSTVYWRTGDLREVQQVQVVTYLFNVYGN